MKKIALACSMLLLSSMAWSADYALKVVNKTGVDLYQVFVSAGDSKDWEEDLLDEDEILGSGENFKLTLKDYSVPIFDVKGVDEDGNEYTKYDVDVEKNDVILTAKDLEP